MDVAFLLRGMVIGFSIAAPVGPIGALCIQRTLVDGRASGLLSGLGAASADAVYGGIAGFGLTFISGFLIDQRDLFALFGGAFLLYLGGGTFVAEPAGQGTRATTPGLAGAYASTFLLTLANQMTILSFAAVFAGLGLADTGGDYGSSTLVVFGVFTGSALWWLTLSGVVGLLRTRIHQGGLRWVNRMSGTVILAAGLLALASLR